MAKTRRKFSPAFKQEAVALITSAFGDRCVIARLRTH